ncbi:outer membrane protein transport protein [Flavobacterium lacisediminis]|uniref:Long-chain fatty acid transport protein n=1 Tax=Flavobacterium lacisediminis TaxID=2989705 RepID=A0ABT3EHM4_9FLAO|nr:hypothetical protein [Flavobacterium lacisediminis]MCW1148080.1 hypothetical protein [Flavobacterium lacisediminis]
MIKKLIVFASILFSIVSWSQENTSSPYSYYGLGEIRFKGTEDVRAMGGLGIVSDSIHLNLLNPASYSKIKFSTFAVGATSSFSTLEANETSEKTQRTSLNYIAVAIPIKKFGFTFGLMPYSSVGYKIENNVTNTIDNTERNKRNTGNGNINSFFLGSAYSINKKFSVGLDVSYNFGEIETEYVESIYSPIILQLRSREKNLSNITGLSLRTGLFYNTKLNEKHNIFTSFTFSPEAKLTSKNERNIATIIYNVNGTELISTPSQDIPVDDQTLIIPTKFSFGAGMGRNNKWLLGTEITFTENSKMKNRFGEIAGVNYENSTRIAFGGYYIPKYDSFSNYFSRVTYRAGFRYENSGLVLRNESINDYGMTFGLGLPVGLSKINLGFEFGKKGTTAQGLVQENYFNLNIGLSLNDLWFRKREIN